jgi:hypothetical protein
LEERFVKQASFKIEITNDRWYSFEPEYANVVEKQDLKFEPHFDE